MSLGYHICGNISHRRELYYTCLLYTSGKLWKFKLSEVDDWIRSGGAADDKVDDKEDKAE